MPSVASDVHLCRLCQLCIPGGENDAIFLALSLWLG
jgi:hypothetical protein